MVKKIMLLFVYLFICLAVYYVSVPLWYYYTPIFNGVQSFLITGIIIALICKGR